ncbi:MAG TPA: TIM barrel protein [Prolixibacteraceae bacterium]|nr:TIM barrel protein [Prolixibacteraceae bacterium]
MKRRSFLAVSALGVSGTLLIPNNLLAFNRASEVVRLGGPVYGKYNSPEEWIQLLRKAGYKAAYCPVEPGAGAEVIRAYREAAEKNNITIAEVGAWSNPLSANSEEAGKAFKKCTDALALAEEINARCAVNISGSRNPAEWDGPDPLNLTRETFDLIVETTRKIIDTVKPSRTFFTLEMMPWMYPDSTQSCLDLMKAIGRKQFAVHLDPVNMVLSPSIYYNTGDLIRDAFKKLGPHIRSVHAKDILIRVTAPQVQFDEVIPGNGILDYPVLLKEIAKIPEIPLMIEHLNTAEDYKQAAGYIRKTGKSCGIDVSDTVSF